MQVKVIIPFRDRGQDFRRGANKELVLDWWIAQGFSPAVVSDGGSGNQQFNRHKAYNRAVDMFPGTDVFVFTEADMLIHPDQIVAACGLASAVPGLVVPFTQYRYLSDKTTTALRDKGIQYGGKKPDWWQKDPGEEGSVFTLTPESLMDDGDSIGAVNVVSRDTLNLTGGFTEQTEGNWYDDNITEEGFAALTGNNTRWVEGPAVHLYHLPGWEGDHLTMADRKATQRNKSILVRMRTDIRMGNFDTVRRLMAYREGAR